MTTELANAPTHTFQMLPARADRVDHGEIILPVLWKQMHDEGSFEMFFHDFPALTFGQFVRLLSEPNEEVHAVCAMEGDTIMDVAAIAMLTDIRITGEIRRALGNFLLFKKYWDSEQSTKIGLQILDGWFAHLDTVAGVTPVTNERALRFAHKMGFVSVGVLPDFASYRGAPCGSMITFQTKKMWMQHRESLIG